MNLSYLNVVLTYLTIGFAAAIVVYFIFKRHVIGKFWGALIVGFIGSFLGGVVYQTFHDFFQKLAVFNDVNVFAAGFSAFILIWIFSKLSSSK